ncbi:MAG: 4Fe-4S single cluster domain-containing protein [Candidatus Magasanikbacteria bacterium]
MSKIHLHEFVPRTEANGSGVRAGVWVQGCPRRCEGCWNTDALEFDERNPTDVDELADRICRLDVDGAAFSGGEPFSQAEPLAELMQILRARLGEDFSLVCFTGHTLKQIERLIENGKDEWEDLLDEVDLLVAGPYERELRLRESLRGSANQRLHFLTDRIDPEEVGPTVEELTLGSEGDLVHTGFPEDPNRDLVEMIKEVDS